MFGNHGIKYKLTCLFKVQSEAIDIDTYGVKCFTT